MQRGENGEVETSEAKRKNGEAREAEQGEGEDDEIGEGKEEDREEGSRKRNGGKGNEREQYAWWKHLRLIIDHLSIRLPMLAAYPSESLYAARCFRPLKTNPVVEGPSGASSWTASAGGTSAFSI